MTRSVEETVRAAYACYPARDRETHESLIAEDFHFTSPYNERIVSLSIDRLFANGNEAFVRYTVQPKDGPAFRNVELVRTENGKIREVEVYFGQLPRPA